MWKDMGGVDTGPRTRGSNARLLVVESPCMSVRPGEQGFTGLAPRRDALQQLGALVGDGNMPGRAGLGIGHQQRARIRMPCIDAHGPELPIAATRQQRRRDQIPKVRLASVHQPPALVLGEITQAGLIHVRERFQPPPGYVVGDLLFGECEVQTRPPRPSEPSTFVNLCDVDNN